MRLLLSGRGRERDKGQIIDAALKVSTLLDSVFHRATSSLRGVWMREVASGLMAPQLLHEFVRRGEEKFSRGMPLLKINRRSASCQAASPLNLARSCVQMIGTTTWRGGEGRNRSLA